MALEDLLSIYLIYNEDSLCAVNPISCDPNLSEDDWLKPISQTITRIKFQVFRKYTSN